MRSFRDIPLRTKLYVMLAGIVSVALLLAGTLFILNDVRHLRASLTNQITALGDVLGANSAAALSFGDPVTGEEVLDSLQREPTITFACTYDADGQPFAVYPAGEAERASPLASREPQRYFAGGSLHVLRPIVRDGQFLGSIYLQASLRQFYSQIVSSIAITLLVLAGSLTAAMLLAARLQRVVSEPILQLVAATRRVAARSDYSIRVEKPGDDELGTLCDAFNSMLAQLEDRETELKGHREHLEQLVRDRTQSLEAQTAALAESQLQLNRVLNSLARSNHELARSNAELEQFAYIASHDLQEPLRKVQAFGDLLVSRFRDVLDDEGQDYLHRMQNAAARMKVLINDLLTYSRVTSKAQPFTAVDLAGVAREVASDLETRLHDTGGRLEIGLLPQLDAEPTQMRQLLQNLLGNALKYHRPDAAPVVQVDSRVLDNSLGTALANSASLQVCEIRVRDNGIGFDEKYLDRIFAPFVRLHGRGEFEGTGMGLAVCRKIVERHGGQITATSTPGQGSTFLVLLPFEQPPPEPAEP